jgi:hypothetical protein
MLHWNDLKQINLILFRLVVSETKHLYDSHIGAKIAKITSSGASW